MPLAGCEVRYRIADGRKELAGRRIERERRPRAAAAVLGPLRIAPSIRAELITNRNGVESPDLTAIERIERDDSAAHTVFTAGDADDHEPVPCERSGGNVFAE